MIAVVVSRADRASEHVGEHLLEIADWQRREDDDRPDDAGGGTYYRREGFELRTFEELHLSIENAAAAFDDPDLLVFASRHSGDTGALLTAHFTGNFGPAKFGGEDGELARAAPGAHGRLLAAFAEHAPEGYEVGTECTHHGPSRVGVPSLFAEVGSDEPQWDDPDAARAVARSILDLTGVDPGADRTVVGFGGGHYAPRFERIARETAWAVGHVAADWALEAMGEPGDDREVIRQAFERSGARHAMIDGTHPDLAATIEDLGYRVVGETWLREVGDRPLPVVDRLESAIAPVDDGLRFGDRRVADPDDLAVTTLPAELLDEAVGIDREDARRAVGERTVAFDTEDGGTRPAATVAVAAPADRSAIVDALAEILARSYDAVRRREDAVVAEETAFDPALAREAGVPEGPAFGRLSNGEAVEVDGETVDPSEVHVERTREFPL